MRPTFFDTVQILTPDTHPGLLRDFVAPVPLPEQTARKPDDPSLKEAIRRGFFRRLGGRQSWSQPGNRIEGAKLRKILVFRYDAVGDFIVSTPITRWLAAALPEAVIDVVTCNRNDSLLRHDPFIRRTIMIAPGHDMSRTWLRVLRLRYQEDYDLVLAPIWTRLSKAAVLAAGAGPQALKATFLHPGREQSYGLVFDYQVPQYAWREHRVELTRRMVLETIDPVQTVDPAALEPYLALDPAAWATIRVFLQRHELGFRGFGPHVFVAAGTDVSPFAGHAFAVLNISSFMPDRQWHDENCAAFIRRMLAEYPELHILITGAPNADANAIAIAGRVDSPRCTQVSFTLAEFTALAAAAQVVITPDSAPVHLAAAAGVPVAALYSRFRDACEWYPWGVDWSIALSPGELTIHDIEPELMFEATRGLMERISTGQV